MSSEWTLDLPQSNNQEVKKMKTTSNNRGQRPPVLRNQTGQCLTIKPKPAGKPRRPHLTRFRTALRHADSELMRAMKEFRDGLKTPAEANDFFDIEERANTQIMDLFESVRSYCEEDLDRPFAAEFIGFATAAEHELCRFVTERSLLCQEIVDAVEMAEFDNDHSF
jgi:hypothetical protein